MNYSLETKLSQKMTLTKELKQSLDILQMTTQDIETLANEEVKENPLLELEHKNEIDWEKYLEHMKKTSLKISSNFYEESDEENNLENYVPMAITLMEHLEEEISILKLDKFQYKIARYLITLIDDDGYIKTDLAQCSDKLKIDLDDIEEVLYIIQGIEPTGIGARSIEECLILQLEDKNYKDEILYKIVEDDLQNIAKHRYKELVKKYSISEEQLKKYIDIIKGLDPKPGSVFASFTPVYILPDVVVEKTENELIVKSNKEANVSITINKTYEKMLTADVDLEAKQYLKDKMTSASNLIKSIEQRKNTILKVASSIVEEQKDFFLKGKAYLTPMKMKDIAELTGFHESTISRTVNGKYMLTPNGLFEFKFFFSNKIMDTSGESLSNKSVKDKIKKIIQNENKKKPYSDKKICDILSDEKIEISRRTVTKYREELQLPSSTERKEI